MPGGEGILRRAAIPVVFATVLAGGALGCGGDSAGKDASAPDLAAPETVASDLAPADPGPVVVRDEKGFEVDPPGAWYAGDLHVHASGASKGTGEVSYPVDIARVARDRGLSFVVLTDHSYADRAAPDAPEDPAKYNSGPDFPYWDEAATRTEPGKFLMVDGAEVCPIAAGTWPTEPRGHVGCIPQDLATFDRSGAFTDRPPGEVTGGQAVAQVRQRGGLVVIAHPYDMLVPIAYDWTSDDYDAMEIWYGTFGFDATDQSAYDAWRCDLLAGRRTVGVGGAACHHLDIAPPGDPFDPALGFPRTSVFAPELTWPAVMEGLKAGRVSVHDGDSLLVIDGYDPDRRRAEGRDVRVVRLRGRLDASGDEASLTLRRATACTDTRPAYDPPPTIVEQVLHTATIRPGETFDVAVDVDGGAGVYTAMLVTQSAYWGALSRAIVVPGT